MVVVLEEELAVEVELEEELVVEVELEEELVVEVVVVLEEGLEEALGRE